MFVAYLIELLKKGNKDDLEEKVEAKYDNILIALIILVLSIIMVVISSEIIVTNATKLAKIIGTNIFNICIVLGLPVAIYGDITLKSFSIIDILTVFLSSLSLYLFAKSEKTISKKEGLIMLAIFLAYYIYLFNQ